MAPRTDITFARVALLAINLPAALIVLLPALTPLRFAVLVAMIQALCTMIALADHAERPLAERKRRKWWLDMTILAGLTPTYGLGVLLAGLEIDLFADASAGTMLMLPFIWLAGLGLGVGIGAAVFYLSGAHRVPPRMRKRRVRLEEPPES